MTHQYELMVILDPEIDERTVAPSLDKFLNVIRNDGGTIDNIDIWGRRRLAYEIQKKSEGIYAVVNFTANSDATIELDRQLKLSEAVLRTKVLRAEVRAARAVAVTADNEKRAARKAAAAAKNPKAIAAAAEKVAAEKAAAAKAAEAPVAEAPAAEAPAAEAPAAEAPAAEAEAPVEKPKAAAKPKVAKAEVPVESADTTPEA
jgi:small subunit ribosomal protein S6